MTVALLYNAIFKEPNYCQAAVPGAEDEWEKTLDIPLHLIHLAHAF